MRRRWFAVPVLLLIALIVVLTGTSEAQRPNPSSEEARIEQGFRIARSR